MKKIILYGAGGTGEKLAKELLDIYEILCLVDSDLSKWGGKIRNIKILNPEVIKELDFDYIVIASAPGYDEIIKKCREYGVPEEKIIDKYVIGPLESRIHFLQKWSELYGMLDGACAEAGVFAGDFAKYINKFFPSKKLYLFDTFEGFCEQDIGKEIEGEYSYARKGDYGNTSEDLVYKKMPFKENVIIKKGYFPSTATGINDMFLFVNLDLDLYEPTLKGLYFFKDRMVRNGIILVHDYFSNTFYGPMKAVDEFLKENKQYTKLPIGDGISVMIVGF